MMKSFEVRTNDGMMHLFSADDWSVIQGWSVFVADVRAANGDLLSRKEVMRFNAQHTVFIRSVVEL